MKISLDRDALLRSLARVQGVVERRGTIPILANVRMRAGNGTLSLATTDMDLEIEESLAVSIDVAGATTVPAYMLHEIVRKLPTGARVDMGLEPEGNIMTIAAGRSRFKLSCLPVEDFPELGAGEMATRFTLPAAQLRILIDRTRFAMSMEETRYYLNGIYIHQTEAEGVALLRAVATDGHRLARFEMPLPPEAIGMPAIIIPRKAVGEIRKLIDETADGVEIALSPSKIQFSFDHTILTSKLIDGAFPDYERVIPSGNDKTVELDPKLFSAAIDRVSTISEGKTRAVKISLQGQTVTISASSPEAGSATEEMEAGGSGTGAEMEIGFNAKYLLDITTRVESDRCVLVLADPSAPTILRDEADPSALYVLMPLRV